MTNEAIEAAARAMGRVISFDGDPISHYATADELTAMARAAAPALMEEGARLERERIVAWLRDPTAQCFIAEHRIADAIEAGEHLK